MRSAFYRPRVEAFEDRILLSFISAASYAVRSYPTSMAVGDFNGDTIPDLAVAGTDYDGKGTVNILLGKGDGTFLSAVSYLIAALGPTSVVVGDFNGDGKADLAVANFLSNTVSVLFNKGDGSGTFQFPVNFGVGAGPSSVAVGDFNGDGIPDLVVANAGTYPNYNDGSITILLGNRYGMFRSAQSFAAGPHPISVAMGDFNGDGIPDLAVANSTSPSGAVTVLLGKGDGTFQAAQNYVTGASPLHLAMGDFNGDGFPDLAVTFFGGVAVLLNAADWGGGSAPVPPRRPGPQSVVLRQAFRDRFSGLVAASQPQALRHGPDAFTAISPNSVQQWLQETMSSEPAAAETFSARPLFISYRPRDALFEHWGRELLDTVTKETLA